MPVSLAEKIARVGKQVEGERRNVTVLFADLSGYTSISERLDPEQVYELIDSTLRAFTEEIYKHEGTLDKVMGDGLMALFGAPIAHEDDSARAVRTAFGMQDALRRINADLESRLGITLQVRIGLNAGLVVVGSIGSDLRMEYTALGDTVNVASRLQNAGEPGTILVSRAVYEPTNPLFEYRELGAIRVKNRVEPVEIFEAVAPRKHEGRVRGIPGLSAPMVGRRAEFAQVRQAVDALVEEGMGRLVLATGNAGIGKSRLTTELKAHLVDQHVTVLEGACLAYGQPAYGMFIRLLKMYFGIADDDSEQVVREKIERTANEYLLPEQSRADILPYIEHLFSIRVLEKEMAARIRHLAPPQLQQQTFLAIRELLIARARYRPLVLIFEDVHWIDPVSLDLLVFINNVIERSPVVIYCNSRPTEGTAAPRLEKLGTQSYAAQFLHLPLMPLSHADSVELVDLLLTIHELPERLRQIILQRAEGNPFYLEEIIRMLIDRGIIRREEDRWQIVPGAAVDDVQVPTTLQGLIMTRVDALSEGARQAAQCAAVIGRDFGLRLLSSTLEDARNLADQVGELEERALVSRIGADGDVHYRFNHILIQETVYASLLVRRREFLHHKIAEGIEAQFKERLDEHTEELAFHYYESKDYDRALPCLIRAGSHAAERFANDQALKQFRFAVECLGKTNPTTTQKIDLYNGLGSVQTFTADYDGATTSYLIALEMNRALTRTVEAQRQSAEIMREIGRVCERRGDYAEALRWLNNALGELEHLDRQVPERVRIYNDIGWVQYRLGAFDQAYEWRMKSLQIVEGTDNYSEMASTYNGLAVLFSRKGDWERAAAYVEKGLHLRESIGDLTGVTNSHNNLGNIALGQGDWDRALIHFERTLDVRQKTGDTRGIAQVNNNLGLVYREKGDHPRARDNFAGALASAEKIKDGNLCCLALNNLAHVFILQQEFDRALEQLKRSLDIATEIGHKENRVEALWLTGEAYLGKDMLDEAYQAAADARTLAAEIGSRVNEGQALRVLGKVARVQGAYDVAVDYLQRSLDVLTKLNNPIELARTRYQLGLVLRARLDLDGAHAAFTDALATFERLGAQAEAARTRAELDELKNQA
ncbi:MAG: tetratricopeptide repeat protein [Chloroflexi bacterium]|nr:tetratricopeptide repeat protein [Chloroflexota bacterium]